MGNNIPVVTDDQTLDSEVPDEGISGRADLLEHGQMVVIPMNKEQWDAYVAEKFGTRSER